jgi:hypothetical protein
MSYPPGYTPTQAERDAANARDLDALKYTKPTPSDLLERRLGVALDRPLAAAVNEIVREAYDAGRAAGRTEGL